MEWRQSIVYLEKQKQVLVVAVIEKLGLFNSPDMKGLRKRPL